MNRSWTSHRGWLLTLGLLSACAISPATGTPALTPTSTADPVERGRVLFRDKGCVTCHVNDRAGGETGYAAIGPDLSQYANSDTDFLRRWLADPPAERPGTQMIDLDLSSAEIEDLVAFLNAPR